LSEQRLLIPDPLLLGISLIPVAFGYFT